MYFHSGTYYECIIKGISLYKSSSFTILVVWNI